MKYVVRRGLAWNTGTIDWFERAEFNVAPFCLSSFSIQGFEEKRQVAGGMKQRRAMIGKRQRNEASPSYPAFDAAKNKSILELLAGR